MATKVVTILLPAITFKVVSICSIICVYACLLRYSNLPQFHLSEFKGVVVSPPCMTPSSHHQHRRNVTHHGIDHWDLIHGI